MTVAHGPITRSPSPASSTESHGVFSITASTTLYNGSNRPSDVEQGGIPPWLKELKEVPLSSGKLELPSSPDLAPEVIELYPADHPRGWIAIIATFCCNFTVFGYNYAWGLFQDQYLEIYKGQVTTFSLSFVGSLGIAVLFLFGPVVGMLVKRIGIRIPITLGGILVFLGLFLASYATQAWHLYLTHGLLFGMGGALTFFSTIHLPSQWFAEKKALAAGIALSGSGVGGLFMDQVIHMMIERLGYRWALRILSFMCLFLIAISAVVAKERIIARPPPFPKTWGARCKALVDFSLLRNGRFFVLTLMGFITTFGYIAPFYFLPSYSSFIGLSLQMGATLTSIMSAVNAIGRILIGYGADKGGRVNALVICTFIAALSCLVIWPFANSVGILTVFVIFYGLTGGGFVSLIPVVCALLVPLEDLPNAMGILFFSQTIGSIFGPAILGALLDATAPNTSYIPGMMFCGAVSIVGGFIALGLRLNMDRRIFKSI